MAKRSIQLTQEQLLALAGAAIYAAINLSDGHFDPNVVAMELNAKAAQLVTTSGLSATQLKDLGLDLCGRAVNRRG